MATNVMRLVDLGNGFVECKVCDARRFVSIEFDVGRSIE